MRIAFFGTPEPAVPYLDALVDAGHEVVAVVTQPDRPAGRGPLEGFDDDTQACDARNSVLW